MGVRHPASRIRRVRAAGALALAILLAACSPAPSPVPSSGALATDSGGDASPSTPQPGGSQAAPVGDADLVVWSSHDAPPQQGTVAYHVWVTNFGFATAASGVTLTITPPDGARLVTTSRDSRPTASGGGVEVDLGVIEPSTTEGVDVDVEWATAPAPGAWTELRAGVSSSSVDPDPASNVALDGERVPQPDLAVTFGPASERSALVPGETVAYSIDVANRTDASEAAPVLEVLLPEGLAFAGASGPVSDQPVVGPASELGTQVTLPLRPLGAWAAESVIVRTTASDALAPGMATEISAGVTGSAPDADPADNTASTTEIVQAGGADTWVEIDAKGDQQIGGKVAYRIRYGNRGSTPADDVTLTLAMPAQLGDLRFSTSPAAGPEGAPPSWSIGTLAPSPAPRSIEVTATVTGTGAAAVTAEIASAGDTNPANDTATSEADLVALAMPVVAGPVNAIVGQRPVVSGTGTPGATVTVSVGDGGDAVPRPFGSGKVDGGGRWEVEPEFDLADGWHWFTATQQQGDRESDLAGSLGFVSTAPAIDPSSLTVDGGRVGGIDQEIDWPAGAQRVFRAVVTACREPVEPRLLAEYYDAGGHGAGGAVVNRQVVAPSSVVDGAVEFPFLVPRTTQEVEWQMSLVFGCRDAAQSDAGGARLVVFTAGILEDIERTIDCWFGNCPPEPPKPPAPAPRCKGCVPWVPPKKPAPEPNDPSDWHVARRGVPGIAIG
jgi:hypothetical protein